ncbi:hypothetical protein LTR15_004163 [Elasticomyces elasticus]|nr:hypothetical protein LTR15_004163 [Elasticomyces elasticus]
MYGTALLLFGLCILATFTSALPAAANKPFQVSKLAIQEIEGANTTIDFTVYDPDPLTNATAVCTGIWTTGTAGYPQSSYKTCGNSTFGWNMFSYTNIQNFVLGIEHSFTDPSVGKPPYDQLTIFGRGNVTHADFVCTARIGRARCDEQEGSTVRAPIYAVIA